MASASRSSAKGPPESGGIPIPPQNFRPKANSTRIASKDKKAKGCNAPTESKFLLPPLSVYKPKQKSSAEIAKEKRKVIRRNIPPGEDLKQIKQIIKSLKGQEVTVHEFVGLVAPYTGDNGTLLRTILATELSAFRKLVKKIYDTMSQDVGDVLTNEHIQLTEVSKERHAHYTDKMMRAIDEIYEYCPNFDFEKYYSEPHYLDSVFPLVEEAAGEEEHEQMQMRQEAYHRLMWLRSEGDRLSEENKRLQGRLRELKKRQRDEMKRTAEMEKDSARKRQQLEKAQEQLEDQLEDMNRSIEKSLVEQEKSMREEEDVMPQIERPPPKQAPKPKIREAENWNIKTAADIEGNRALEALIAETSKVSVASSKSTGAIPKVPKPKTKTKKKKSKSKVKTPPQKRTPEKQLSPFHYSPPKTPPEYYWEQEQDEAAAPTTCRIISSTTVVEEEPAGNRRRARAPRDTWGGFY